MEEPQETGAVIKITFNKETKFSKVPKDFEITLVRVDDLLTESMPWVYVAAPNSRYSRDPDLFGYPDVKDVFSWQFLLENCSSIKIGKFE